VSTSSTWLNSKVFLEGGGTREERFSVITHEAGWPDVHGERTLGKIRLSIGKLAQRSKLELRVEVLWQTYKIFE
jgi:hypothetical protein